MAIAPLRLARGTQNKVLECMAMGIPVVATPGAAAGIQATAGVHLLVADNPGEFARRSVELLNSPETRWQIGEAGRVQAQSAHQWPKSMKILDAVLAQAAEQSAAQRK
jgi:glycosyltransferase involved in cell wall biosynthesis